MNTWNPTANQIFLDAIEIDDLDQQSLFLEKACEGLEDIKAEVVALLDAHRESEGFLSASSSLTDAWRFDTSVPSYGTGSLGLDRPSTSVAVGQALGRYRLDRQLGAGGMGVVYLATDTRLNRSVAIKIPRFDAMDDSAQRLEREARSMALVKHPNLASVLDVDQWNGLTFLIMEFVEGECLSDVLKQEARLPADRAAALMLKMAEATACAHAAGVVHRDIKPGNIIMDPSGEPVLLDFGLAYIGSEDARMTKTGAVIGTPAYMAPEQLTGAQHLVGPHSDIYALGAILYELLTGRTVYTGSATQVMQSLANKADVIVPSSIEPSVDQYIEAICMKAIARDPSDRFATADDMAQALRFYMLGRHDELLKMFPLLGHSRGAGSGGRWGWCIAAGFMGFVVSLAIWVIQTNEGEFVLSTDDPEIATRLDRSGGLVVENRATNKTYTLRLGKNALPNGKYELVVTTPDGLELSTDRFQLKRFSGEVIASVVARSSSDKTLPTDSVTRSMWSEPVRVPFLGPEVRSSHGSISGDGLNLVMVTRQADGAHLSESHRNAIDAPFSEPMPIEGLVFEDQGQSLSEFKGNPWLSPDALDLILFAVRPNEQRGPDLWITHRNAIDAPWGPLRSVGANINSAMFEYSGSLSADRKGLVWFRPNPLDKYDGQLWYATRSSDADEFNEGVLLNEAINTLASEQHPYFSPDGSSLLFDRGTPDPRIWIANCNARTGTFENVRRLELPLSWLERSSYAPSMTSDNKLLIFTSNEIEGKEGFESCWLWQCRRLP